MERQTEICRRAIKAFVEGIHFIRTNKPESMRIIARRMRLTDAELIEINYSQQGLRRTLPKPTLSEEGIQMVLTMLSERTPAAPNRAAAAVCRSPLRA
ncbi:MAG: hypothetical protein DME96_09205 [Verrucomicrobia bacterium]|nr:MAG: hypothetical protein DME96_09205 [Verrucomicrobiota bacterium]